MRALALTALVLTAPLASADSEATLRQRCAEQERQIATLETEIESLHSKLALERRRSRGSTPVSVENAPKAKTVTTAYKVKAGDTLSSIARKNGTTVTNLQKVNGISDPTRLLIGQTIHVTGSPTVAKAPAPAKKAPVAAKKPSTYKVQPGDTFYKVAHNHSLTVTRLQELNPGVNPSHIIVGQTLGVAGEPRKAVASRKPAPRTTSRTITTPTPAKKSTPKPVAKKSTPAPAPKPVAKKPTPKPAPKPAPAPKPQSFSSIIVMNQISFGDFAEKHGTTTDQLNALNGLSLKPSTLLAKGSELYVSNR